VGNFYPKKSKFSRFLAFLSPYFYTDNVTIILKRTEDLGIPQKHKNLAVSLKRPVGIALPSACDAYWFLVFFSRFGITKFEITETLLSTVIVKTIIVSLHRGRFVVVHLIQVFLLNSKIFPKGQIFTKNYHL